MKEEISSNMQIYITFTYANIYYTHICKSKAKMISTNNIRQKNVKDISAIA